jgi:hypothetical protein
MLSEIKKETPHIQNTFEVLSYQTGCSMAFMIYAIITNGTGIAQLDKESQFERYQSRRLYSLIFFDEIRFETNSFKTFSQTINNFNEQFKCLEGQSLDITKTTFETYQCFTSEMLFSFLYSLFDEAFSVQMHENTDKALEIEGKC